MIAEGGSWAGAAGDRRYWGDGRLRTTLVGGAGRARYDVNLSSIYNGLRLPLQQEFSGVLASVGYEVRDDFWVSAGFKAARTEMNLNPLEIDEPDSFVEAPRLDYQMALLKFGAAWDTRDDQFYPRDGAQIKLDINLAETGLGSDTDYVNYELSYNGYRAFGDRHTLAWRVAGKALSGDPPFYALAWYGSGVDLRGYAPGTYIGDRQLVAQAEWRWQMTHRIGVVAFGGVGGVWGDQRIFEQDDFLPAGGIGLRWRLADKFRINFLVDYAWGKDDEVLLVSVGEAF
jgi:outer membrane protein assembly factor BamA